MEIKYLDQAIFEALRKRMKVELFLCKDVDGGFGIKINGKVISRNQPWEVFENELNEKEKALLKKVFKQ